MKLHVICNEAYTSWCFGGLKASRSEMAQSTVAIHLQVTQCFILWTSSAASYLLSIPNLRSNLVCLLIVKLCSVSSVVVDGLSAIIL